jgi:hypothetical protein
MSTSSEEFRKFVNRLLYEESKINIQNFNNLQIFERALTLKASNNASTKNNSSKTFEDPKSTQENFISTQFNSSISSSIHQQLQQQSNAENQMK